MAFAPVVMLSLTKGLEITFESLPESVIQSVFVLSSEYNDISILNYVGLVSSVISAGLILTDANLGVSRSQMVSAPRNPVYNFLPSVKVNLYLCMIGFFVFSTFYFMLTVFTISLAYLRFGGHVILYSMLTEFSIVMLYKHFIDKEFFAFALQAKTSQFDYIIGPVAKFVYYVMALFTYMPNSKNPCELGPHVTSSLIVWRMVTNSVVVMLMLPRVVIDKALPWMTVTGGLIFYFLCLFLSLVGAYIQFEHQDEKHERWRWWRRQTGKDHFIECWNSDTIWWAGFDTKESEMASCWMTVNPLYLPMERIKIWLCVEIDERYGKKEEEEGETKEPQSEAEEGTEKESSTLACPKWLTQAFHDRMIEIFIWYGNESYLIDVRVALKNLPKCIEPKIEKLKSKKEKEKKTAKVAPEGTE